jgi:hypothetical protein
MNSGEIDAVFCCSLSLMNAFHRSGDQMLDVASEAAAIAIMPRTSKVVRAHIGQNC